MWRQQSAAGLAHANIVNIYDTGEEAGIYYIVMELVEGITLKEYIKGKDGCRCVRRPSIALQISAGLEAAHNNGISTGILSRRTLLFPQTEK